MRWLSGSDAQTLRKPPLRRQTQGGRRLPAPRAVGVPPPRAPARPTPSPHRLWSPRSRLRLFPSVSEQARAPGTAPSLSPSRCDPRLVGIAAFFRLPGGRWRCGGSEAAAVGRGLPGPQRPVGTAASQLWRLLGTGRAGCRPEKHLDLPGTAGASSNHTGHVARKQVSAERRRAVTAGFLPSSSHVGGWTWRSTRGGDGAGGSSRVGKLWS